MRLRLLLGLALVAAPCGLAGRAPAAAPHGAQVAVGIGVGGGTVTSAPRGIRCGVICSGSFRRGTSVVLVARPNRHFTLQRWTGGCSGAALRCTIKATGPTAVVATFMPRPGHGDEVSKETPILDVGVGAGGRVRSSPSGIDCSHDDLSCFKAFGIGTEVRLVATPARGRSFVGWSGAPGVADLCAARAECVVTVNFSVHIDAAFRGG
jgi:hypothetical protein